VKRLPVLSKALLALGLVWAFSLFWSSYRSNEGAGSQGDKVMILSGRRLDARVGTVIKDVERDARPLSELLEALEEVNTSVGFEFLVTNPPVEVDDLLGSLNSEEITILIKHLLQLGDEGTDDMRSTWVILIARQWGKTDPITGIEYTLKEIEEGSPVWWSVYADIYAGWSELKSQFAWDHFVELIPRMADVFHTPYVMSQTAALILNRFAADHPNQALRVLVPGPQDQERGLNSVIRDSLIKGLPEGSDWEEIANLSAKRTFGMLDVGGIVEGPGAVLFARWARESPNEALAWFSNHKGSSDSMVVPDFTELISVWYRRAPEIAGDWVQRELQQGDNAESLEAAQLLISWHNLDRNLLNWARQFPDQGSRFKILESAAHSADVYIERDSGILRMIDGPLNPNSQEVAVVEEMLPLFNLSPEQETEIRQILGDRIEKQAK
jgi:hypothetical protein